MSTQLEQLTQEIAGKRILVIGDIIVDHFVHGTVNRISPEAPVPVVNVNREEYLLGGGANVLHNIFSLGAEAVLCGIIGDDEMGNRLQELLADLGASDEGLVIGKRPTTVKTRVLAQRQQVVRFDREQSGEASSATVAGMMKYITTHLADFDAIIISDYFKGVIGKELMSDLLANVQKIKDTHGKVIPVVVDPKPGKPDRFYGSTLITPNQMEAEKVSGITIDNNSNLKKAAKILLEKVACEAVLITRGEHGMALLEKDKPLLCIPTNAREVFDVTGAGDTVIAALALGLAAGASFADAAALANIAAGVVVAKVGTATVSRDEILSVLHGEDSVETVFTTL